MLVSSFTYSDRPAMIMGVEMMGGIVRGHLTCTNKRTQADEQKIARNEGLLGLPPSHLLCMFSMLAPSELSHLRKWSAKKEHFGTFPGMCCISESAKKLQKLFGTFSFENVLFFVILVWVIAQEAHTTLKKEMASSGGAHLLVHIRPSYKGRCTEEKMNKQ